MFQDEVEHDLALAPHCTFFSLFGVMGFWKSLSQVLELCHELVAFEIGSSSLWGISRELVKGALPVAPIFPFFSLSGIDLNTRRPGQEQATFGSSLSSSKVVDLSHELVGEELVVALACTFPSLSVADLISL